MQVREIRLYGSLGKQFGRVHRFAVDNVAESIRALQANFPDFEKSFLECAEYYRVWIGSDRVQSVDNIGDPVGSSSVIRIAPVVSGAKGGLGQILLGAAIIAGAALLAPVTGGGSIAWGASAFSVGGLSFTFGNIAMFGISLALGGISQMLAPQPKSSGSSDRPESKPSYIFNGAVNTSAQGNPVPVGYGRMIVGSATISAGLSTVDIS